MKNDIKKILANNVRRARAKLSMSQDELADKCDLHRTYIGGIERAERNITLQSLEKIASALEISPKDLIDDKKQENAIRP